MTQEKDPVAELMRLVDSAIQATNPIYRGVVDARRTEIEAHARAMAERIAELEAELARIKRLGECRAVSNWLELPDERKREWFAIMGMRETWKLRRIAELEAQLEAVGAGGVSALIPKSGAVPDGWQLVPIVAPNAMVCAIEQEMDQQLAASGLDSMGFHRQDGSYIWDAALAAAPKPPAAQAEPLPDRSAIKA